jgi:hypothetical protein
VPPAKKAAASRKAPAKKRTTTTRSGPRSAQNRESRALRNRILTAGALLVVAGIVVFFAARPDPGPSVPEQLKPCRYDEKTDGTKANQGAHVPNPTYKLDPPAGGPHLPTPANPGFYRGDDVPPDGALVHAMEHGFVVLWFKSGLSDDKMQQIEDLSDQFGRELIVAERPSLTDEVAITAWHHRALCASLDPSKVEIFTRAYKDQGPEKGFL